MNTSVKKLEMGVILCRHCALKSIRWIRIESLPSMACVISRSAGMHSHMQVSVSDVTDEE